MNEEISERPAEGGSVAVSVVVPAFNEQDSVGEVLAQVGRALAAAGMEHELIVVDDGSTDRTATAAARPGVCLLRHAVNRGYGAALKTGIKAAAHEAIVIVDADGTYPAAAVPEMVRALRAADMVVGSRNRGAAGLSRARSAAKWVLRLLAQYVTGKRIPDINSGLRAFRSGCAREYASILPDGFSFTTTLTVALLCDGAHILYHPIGYTVRTGASKLKPFHFFDFLTLLARLCFLFRPLKVLLPAGFACIGLGCAKLAADFLIAMDAAKGLTVFTTLMTQKMLSASSVLLILAGLQFIFAGMLADAALRKIDQRTPKLYEPIAERLAAPASAAASVPGCKMGESGQVILLKGVDVESCC